MPSKLTEHQINVAVAELCGWTQIDGPYGTRPGGGRGHPPNYSTDLNAIDAAVRTWVGDDAMRAKFYTTSLFDIVDDGAFNAGVWLDLSRLTATARQRSLALLAAAKSTGAKS